MRPHLLEPALSPPDATPTATDAQEALQRALGFLEASQLPSGEFRVLTSADPQMAGPATVDPSVFPTALVAQALLAAGDQARPLRQRAADFLAAQMDSHGLWRHWTRAHPHHSGLPPDLDDTACAVAVLRAEGRTLPPHLPILLANRDARGLFLTWVTLRPRPVWSAAHWRVTLAQLRHPLLLSGFFRRTSARPGDVDAVVNANVLHALGPIPETRPVVAHLLAVLRGNREASCDKWYDEPVIVRYFFSRALPPEPSEAGNLIGRRTTMEGAANALLTALSISTLLHWSCEPGRVAPMVQSLLHTQMPSGAWPRAALYHGGRARLSDRDFAPPAEGTPRWGSEELTTAFAVEALSRWVAEAKRA